LYFKQSLAYTVALFSATSVIASEIFSWRILHGAEYLPSSVYIALLTMYTIIALLIRLAALHRQPESFGEYQEKDDRRRKKPVVTRTA